MKAKVIIILFAIFFSCSKSPRELVSPETSWILSQSEEQVKVSNTTEVIFSNNSLRVVQGKEYTIEWLSENKFKITIDEKEVYVVLEKLTNELLQGVFLNDSESNSFRNKKIENFKHYNRLLYLHKVNKPAIQNEFYKLNGKQIPVEKVPPSGLYLSNGSEWGFAINIIINDGEVNVQEGEDKNNLVDVQADISYDGLVEGEGYISSIIILNEWRSYYYRDDGILENSDAYFNGNSGGITEFIKSTSSENINNISNNLFEIAINETLMHDFIHKRQEN